MNHLFVVCTVHYEFSEIHFTGWDKGRLWSCCT